jgi:hypothetical protein
MTKRAAEFSSPISLLPSYLLSNGELLTVF